MLATRSPQMRKAVGVLKELSADEATRMLYEKREMARRDIESQLVEQYAIIAEKDAALADKDAALAEKDAVLADKDAENELLRKQVAKLQAKLGEGN